MSAPITNPLGSPLDIAFNAQGTAWLSGGSVVGNYDASGQWIQTYQLGVGSSVGITIDDSASKWIAHREIPGSVSRIDAAGNIVNFAVTGNNPIRPIADYRGPLAASHVWVTCDDGGALLELDSNGTELHNYTMPVASIGGVGPVFDRNGDIWVGSYGGDLFQVDPGNGAVLNTYTIMSPSTGVQTLSALSVDTLGRILCTQRITFSGVGPPCEIQRMDPATGAIEVVTLLQFGGASAAGSQAAVSTPFQWALVVNPLGDADGDGDSNHDEIAVLGTSPIDATSSSEFSVDTTGSTQTGSTPIINVQTASAWAIGFSGGLRCPGLLEPGFLGTYLLDPATAFPVTIGGIGATNTPLPIANNVALMGIELHMQGVIVTASLQLELRNVSGIVVW